jgi:hypothetical protein
MRSVAKKGAGWIVALLFVGGTMMGCATVDTAPKAQLQVVPEKVVLAPDILKAPPVFKGSGFKPKEVVTVDLMIPPGVKIKAIKEGEKSVGIGFANADDQGSVEAKMGATAILNWFFQVEWKKEGPPDMSKASPLAPGTYQIRAVGMESDIVGTAMMEIVHPPKK